MEKMRDVCNMKWFAQEFSHSRTSLNKSTARAVISLFIEMFRLLIMKVKAVKGFIVLAEAGAHWTSWAAQTPKHLCLLAQGVKPAQVSRLKRQV
jgi:hypothetical protein